MTSKTKPTPFVPQCVQFPSHFFIAYRYFVTFKRTASVKFTMKTFCALIISVLLNVVSFGQNAVLPFTGAKILPAGLDAASVEIRVDGYLLTSNVVPVNKEIEVVLKMPTGFNKDASQKYYPAALVTITNPTGQVLGKTADAFAASATVGIVPEKFKELSVKTLLATATVKANKSTIVTIELSDRKSKNKTKLELPVVLAVVGQPLRASAAVVKIKTSNGSNFLASNLSIATCKIGKDEAIKKDSTTSYASIEMETFTGIASEELLGGKESFFIYDALTLASVPGTSQLLKSIKMSVEGGVSKYTVKIPYKKKTDPKKYLVRFRWESKDGKKVIESSSIF